MVSVKIFLRLFVIVILVDVYGARRWQVRTWSGPIKGMDEDDYDMRLRYANNMVSKEVNVNTEHWNDFSGDALDVSTVDIDNEWSYPPHAVDIRSSGDEEWLCNKIELVRLDNGHNFTADVYHYFPKGVNDFKTFYFTSSIMLSLPYQWNVTFYIPNDNSADTNAEVSIQLKNKQGPKTHLIPMPANRQDFKPNCAYSYKIRSGFSLPVDSVRVCLSDNERLSDVSRDFFFTKLTLQRIGTTKSYEFENKQYIPNKMGDSCLEVKRTIKLTTVTTATTTTLNPLFAGLQRKLVEGLRLNHSDPSNDTVIETAAAAEGEEEEEEGSAWTWVLTILGIMIVAGVVFGVVAKRRYDENNEKQDDEPQDDEPTQDNQAEDEVATQDSERNSV